MANEGTYSITPLYGVAHGVSSDCLEVAKLLISYKADINFVSGGYKGAGTGHSILSKAIVGSAPSHMARTFVNAGANVNQPAEGRYPIQHAIKNFPIVANYSPARDNERADGYIDLIKLLLEKGAKTDVLSKDGKTLTDLVHEKFSVLDKDASFTSNEMQIHLSHHQDAQSKDGKSVKESVIPKPTATKAKMHGFYRQKEQEILKMLQSH